MRPRKVISILGAGEHGASILRLVLESRGFAVRIAESPEDMIERGEAAAVFLLIGADVDASEALENRLWAAHPWRGCVRIQGCSLEAAGVSMAELLEALRKACYRKRGPKSENPYPRAVRAAQRAVLARKETAA